MSAAEAKVSGWAKKFERFLVGDVNDKGEQRGFCPIHEEPGLSGTPSASFNWSKGKFFCFADCGGMGLSALWTIVEDDERDARMEQRKASRPSPRRDAPIDLADKRAEKRSPSTTQALPNEERIARWHSALMKSPAALKVIRDKTGWTDETLAEWQIGFNVQDSRYTIPIRDEKGGLLNVRRYKPDAAAGSKMIGITGHNETELFPRKVLAENKRVVLTEGEKDAITGNQNTFPTVTATGGAKRMPEHLAALFTGKIVFIFYDADDTGRAGATKAALIISKYAEAVYVVRNPLSGKEDLTDYFHAHSYTPNEFEGLLKEAEEAGPFQQREYASKTTLEPKDVSLEGSMDAEHGTAPLALTVSVAGKVQPAYLLPRAVSGLCDQSWGETRCGKCEMSLVHNGSATKDIPRDHPVLLELIDANTAKTNATLAKEIFGAPPTCPRLRIDELEKWNVEELLVMPSVDDRGQDTINPITRRVYNVGEYSTPINTVSRLVGCNTVDPRTRRATFQAWEAEQTKTNLDKFQITDELFEALQIFEPARGQSVLDKLRAIAKDLEANVTRIYGRTELHLLYDLVWHSVMSFDFRGSRIEKGWLEALVMGDTRTGKSEAALRLCDHYRAGVLKSCEGATLAGLVGGAQQTGNSWMITWGTIPLNDRRLVVLDEVSGLSDKGIIEQMSAVRSSGRAQVVKIVSQETAARTRLIWISNPPDGRTVGEMPRGAIEAIQQLVKNPEDIARFDIATAAASSDVPSSLINSNDPAQVEHVYTSELCSALVAWAWSRKAEDVVWEANAEDRVLEVAEEIGHEYIPEPPLIQAENVRVKLARIACAIAARLFSCDDTGEKLIVKVEHVEAARMMLDRLYGMASFGYADHSKKTLKARARAAENEKRARKYLLTHSDALAGLQACVGGDFKARDFEEFAGMIRDEAQATVRDLMAMRMLRRMSKGYIRMEPVLVRILKALEEEDD